MQLAARTFIQSQYLKALTVSLRVGFCDEWKRGLNHKVRLPIKRVDKQDQERDLDGIIRIVMTYQV